MSGIKNNLICINNAIEKASTKSGADTSNVRLIAVSKRKSTDAILEAIENGVSDLGENYIQEAVKKIDVIGKDAATWHFIGHLQSNKAKIAVKYFNYIHTVDSIKLASQINKQAQKIDKIQKILIQINISNETTKSGAASQDVIELAKEINTMDNLSLQGLMGMPPYCSDPEDSRPYFQTLCKIRDQILDDGFGLFDNTHLSMGMSNDFKIAIQEGATMVRIGTSIFGQRS